jgi:hypothetical protein
MIKLKIMIRKTKKEKIINHDDSSFKFSEKLNSRINHNEIFQRGNKVYIIPKTNDESREIYLERVNYVIKKNNEDNNLSIDDIIRMSLIWRNITFYQMTYPNIFL